MAAAANFAKADNEEKKKSFYENYRPAILFLAGAATTPALWLGYTGIDAFWNRDQKIIFSLGIGNYAEALTRRSSGVLPREQFDKACGEAVTRWMQNGDLPKGPLWLYAEAPLVAPMARVPLPGSKP